MATTVRLPDPPKEYDSTYVERMINHINLQFRALDPLGIQERLMLDTLTSEPTKIIDGMIVKADGVYWNPDGVNGEGPYMWWQGAWHFLGGGAKPCCPIGRHAIYITAGSMSPSASGGCAALATIPSGAATPDIQTLDFDKDTQKYAQFKIRMPKSWDRGTITFVPVWSHVQTNIGDLVGITGNMSLDNGGVITAGSTKALTGNGGTGGVGSLGVGIGLSGVTGTSAVGTVALPAAASWHFSVTTGTQKNTGASSQYVGATPLLGGFAEGVTGAFSQRLWYSSNGTSYTADTSSWTYGSVWGRPIEGSNHTEVMLPLSDGVFRYTSSSAATKPNTGMLGAHQALMWCGDRYIVFKNNALDYATSADGSAGTWTVASLPGGYPTAHVVGAWSGSKLAVSCTSTNATIITTTDFTNWSTPTVPTVSGMTEFTDMIYESGNFIAVGAVGTNIYTFTSPNGTDWTQRTTINTGNTLIGTKTRLASNGSGIVGIISVQSASTTVQTYWSIDNINWEYYSPGTTSGIAIDIAYGNGVFAIIPNSNNTTTFAVTAAYY